MRAEGFVVRQSAFRSGTCYRILFKLDDLEPEQQFGILLITDEQIFGS